MEQPTLDRLMNFVAGTEITYASHVGEGMNKKLVVTLKGTYKVYDHGEVVHQGMQPHQALDKYNSIQKK